MTRTNPRITRTEFIVATIGFSLVVSGAAGFLDPHTPLRSTAYTVATIACSFLIFSLVIRLYDRFTHGKKGTSSPDTAE